MRYDINASYKDLGAVCDAIRYKRADEALRIIDNIISMSMPIEFKKHNKHMGSRHELGGKKGAYPKKAAKEIKVVLVNAIANARNAGLGGDDMFIVHATANKTRIERRRPSKGTLAWGRGTYGFPSPMHSDLEYAKVEIALANGDEKELSKNMRYFIKKGAEKRKGEKKEGQKKPIKKESAKKGEKKEAKAEKKGENVGE
jgi:large subunit ribosomal protein L22